MIWLALLPLLMAVIFLGLVVPMAWLRRAWYNHRAEQRFHHEQVMSAFGALGRVHGQVDRLERISTASAAETARSLNQLSMQMQSVQMQSAQEQRRVDPNVLNGVPGWIVDYDSSKCDIVMVWIFLVERTIARIDDGHAEHVDDLGAVEMLEDKKIMRIILPDWMLAEWRELLQARKQ